MNILGLDLSTKKSGWAFFKDDSLVDYGVISCDYKDARARMIYTQDAIREILRDRKIDRLVIEDLRVYTNFTTIVALAMAHGCILSTCNELNIEFIAYGPSEWRKVVGIHRSVVKCLTCEWSEEIIGEAKVDRCPKCGERRKKKIKYSEIKNREFFKEAAVRMANKKYGLKLEFYPRDTKKNISDDDIAEAILIAQAHIYELKL